MKTAIVFGAGKVAAPAIRAILNRGHRVVVATDQPATAREIVPEGERASIESVDARDDSAVRSLVARGDLALSLLPANLHGPVARACVAERRAFVSTSYVSPEIRALDEEARASGVLLMNECGLDPGLDHLLAIDLIEKAREDGANVEAFRSICGGIPAPESNDNPFGYKLSWSTRGVALAGTRPARTREDGRVVELGQGEIFRAPRTCEVEGIGTLEFYPNGDSLPYAEKYGLEGARTIYRGTFRWPGWCETWSAIAKLGWLDDAAPVNVTTRDAAAAALGLAPDHPILGRLVWLGLVTDGASSAAPAFPAGSKPTTRLAFLVARMDARLAYAPGERDLVVLRDEIDVTRKDGRRATRAATIVERGTPGRDSAMAKLVGVPAGVVACRMLEGRVPMTGVRIPVDPNLVRALLVDLGAAGIRAVDS